MVKFDEYKVEIEFVKPVVGALPKNKEVLQTWIESRGKKSGKTPPEIQELIEKIGDEVGATEEAEKRWTGFKTDEKGIYLEDRNISYRWLCY